MSGNRSRFSSIAPSAGSPAATTTSHSSSQLLLDLAVQHTDDDERQAGQTVGQRPHRARHTPLDRDQDRTGPFDGDGAGQLRQEDVGAEMFEDRGRYPAAMDASPVQRWAASGVMALTGTVDHALGPPAGLVEGVDRLGGRFGPLDALALLGERAALMGLWRRGATSCGGSCRLFPCADGFLAVSLPRAEDMELVPAWLELDATPPSAPALWSEVARSARHRDPALLLERAGLLGLPVARVGEAGGRLPACCERRSARRRHGPMRPGCWWSTSRHSGPGHSAATSWAGRAQPW